AGAVTAIRMGELRRYALLCGVAGVATAAVGTSYMAHLATLAVGAGRGVETGLAWRIAAWFDGLRVVALHPFAGGGVGNFMAFRQTIDLPRPFLLQDQTRALHPHNLYVQRMAEIGVCGGFIYIALWATALWAGWRITTRGSRTTGESVATSASLFYALVAIAVAIVGENMLEIAGERARLQTIAWLLIALGIAKWNRQRARSMPRIEHAA